MRGSERVVLFDLDGGLADMSEFADILADDSHGTRRQAWHRFFEHVGQAAVVESGRELVEAVAGLGFVPVYSTTRPLSCGAETRRWLDEHGFPPARALLCRARGDGRAAVEVKAGHCRAVGHWLSAFVDDEPEAVRALGSGGFPAHSSETLSGLGVAELRATLTAGAFSRGANRQRRQRGAPRPPARPCGAGNELRACLP